MNLKERRFQKIISARSRLENMSKILEIKNLKRGKKLFNEYEVINELNYLEKTNSPKKGDLFALEDFYLMKTLEYLGIVETSSPLKTKSYEYCEEVELTKEEIISMYATRNTRAIFYKIPPLSTKI